MGGQQGSPATPAGMPGMAIGGAVATMPGTATGIAAGMPTTGWPATWGCG